MMQKLWQKKLTLNYSKDVLDIVQFGSSIIEGKEPNDIDIAVFFNKIPLNDQLNQAQEIKKQLQKDIEISIHVNSFDFYSFFDKSNFAKENILFNGKSLISGDFFSKNFGLTPKIQVYYSLKELKKKEKIRFNYMLNGKKGKYGLIKKYGGKLLKPGLIEISPEFENIFVSEIKNITLDFSTKRVLEGF
ncbi:hypothetical protein HYW76_00870 [Candidatus Pacearchaeota archaeon]|nr:hypothetical protein [Candidatus Pacearchaeota archaeon]